MSTVLGCSFLTMPAKSRENVGLWPPHPYHPDLWPWTRNIMGIFWMIMFWKGLNLCVEFKVRIKRYFNPSETDLALFTLKSSFMQIQISRFLKKPQEASRIEENVPVIKLRAPIGKNFRCIEQDCLKIGQSKSDFMALAFIFIFWNNTLRLCRSSNSSQPVANIAESCIPFSLWFHCAFLQLCFFRCWLLLFIHIRNLAFIVQRCASDNRVSVCIGQLESSTCSVSHSEW